VPDVEALLEELESDDPREALREARTLLEDEVLSPEDRSRLAYGIAAGYFKIGIYGDALDWLEETESDRRWMLKGFCHSNLDQHKQARDSFLKAAREQPENARGALLLAAQSLAAREQYESAVEELEGLLNQDPPPRMDAEIRYNLGMIHVETDDLTVARDWFESVIERPERDAFVDESLLQLAQVLEDLGQIEPALERVNQLDERIEDDSEDARVVSKLRSRLQNQQKDRNDQLRDYDF
jgi:tetratricopeptide (TPR) repeat protein